MEPLGIGILGTGSYVPEHIQTNAELEASLQVQENWRVCQDLGVRSPKVIGETFLRMRRKSS